MQWENYVLVNTEQIQIFARNKDATDEQQTFQINLATTLSEEEATGLQQLTILLMLVLVCCLCVACCTVILRLRCKLNSSRINGDTMERREGAIDRETEERNRRVYEQRRQQQMSAEDRHELRVMAHERLMEKYKKLIPSLRFKKKDK